MFQSIHPYLVAVGILFLSYVGVSCFDQANTTEPKAVDLSPAKSASWLTDKPAPKWVWHKQTSDGQKLFFRKSVSLPGKVKSARLYSTCDNRLSLWINGYKVGDSRDWLYPLENDVTSLLKKGQNSIAAQCQNAAGPAAFVLKLIVETDGGK